MALGACAAIAAISGCGEVDILALDRAKVALVADASGDARDASALEADSQDEADVPSGIYLEAESGQLSGGFTIGNDPTASGGRYIAPPPGAAPPMQQGAARALYKFDITTPGTYTIWGRIQSPDTSHNQFWVQVDGGSWYLWYITTGEVWYWNRVHNNQEYYTILTFDLATGPHELLVANAVDGVRLDRWYLTPGRDVPPGNEGPCHPPNSIQVNGACIPSCGSQMGNECGSLNCMGLRIVPVPVYDCAVCCIKP
jgi:hypothetical protein